MNKTWTRYALWTLVAAVVLDFALHRKRHTHHEHSTHREALMTWEHEGGALY